MASAGPAETTRAHTGGGFRPDVEGLRAVAIVAVVLCHAGIAWLAGGYVGVDVFFVISGFLITSLLINEFEGHGSISLARFYASRARRILPLAAILLATVAVLALVLLSPLRRLEVSSDIVDSALYVVNWHFAAESVNYFAKGGAPSPVLHLWSLSVEEQFYIVWPGLLLGVAWLGHKLRAPVRLLPTAAIALVFAGSLLLATSQSAGNPAYAYFSTFDRAWELALGGLLAIALPRLPGLPRPIAFALGWAGLSAIVAACLFYTGNMPFPGPVALLPTLGAAAIIAAGAATMAHPRAAVGAALSLPPVRYIGRISYGWYLWHWPALVFGALILGPLSPLEGVALVLVALVPTIVSHRLVEDPMRHWRALTRIPVRGLAVGCLCMATAAIAGVMLVRTEPHWRTLRAAYAPGALALAAEPHLENTAVALRPEPLKAPENLPLPIGEGCLLGVAGTVPSPCGYGDRASKRALVLFGDSHAMQHFPELQAIAGRNHWRLAVLTKRECTPGEVTIAAEEGGPYTQCDVWRRNALRRIERTPGAFAVAISGDTAEQPIGPGGRPVAGRAGARLMEEGYVRTIRRLQRAGLKVVVIGDTPEAPTDEPSCVSENTSDLAACSFPEPHRWARGFDLRAAHRTGAAAIPIAPEICPGGRCRAVIGHVDVYRDNAHLTADYARSLADWMEPLLKHAIEGGPTRISSASIRPSPGRAAEDLPTPFHEGCMIGVKGTASIGCVYGDTSGARTLILFGDSHALMHFPALQVVAKRNGWRLEVWTKRECTPAETTIVGKEGGPYTACDTWRETMLKQMEAEGGPATVLLTGESKARAIGGGGEVLSGSANAAAMQQGYIRTLLRIRGAGLGAIVIRDTPEAPDDVASCVAAHTKYPEACNFAEPHQPDREFEVRAARKTGTPLIDLDSAICARGECKAVVKDVLVYRDEAHLTADFDRTLAPRFETALKKLLG